MSERRDRVLELFDEQKVFMEEKVQAGIEFNRKGIGQITVRDGAGNPIADAKISLKHIQGAHGREVILHFSHALCT